MAKLPILEFPDPRLRTVAKPIVHVDDALRALIDDMFETMYAAPGIGLAASQVDVHRRLLVLDVSEHSDAPMVFINPEILFSEGEQTYQEGCLSVPGIYADVHRAERIRVRALNRDGNQFECDAHGVLAVCIQHEMDHLAGKLFVDYLSPLKREMVKKKLAKARREAAAEAEDAAQGRANVAGAGSAGSAGATAAQGRANVAGAEPAPDAIRGSAGTAASSPPSA